MLKSSKMNADDNNKNIPRSSCDLVLYYRCVSFLPTYEGPDRFRSHHWAVDTPRSTFSCLNLVLLFLIFFRKMRKKNRVEVI